ncbi:tumor necrosis factor receptor superfamily member 21-like isoform X2 [Patiria miniata]|uniref:Uncharacterized protein n=1 Tax=Patiria miniata TaxID=46514 RepID=A0A914BS65_PATMI|nr:tumor necrosis factor receptor superfamily member 21-like isoform X2 [Patiria miniata]
MLLSCVLKGDSCLLSGSSGDVYYEYIDATGLECQCELCFPGRIVARNCTCDRSTLDIPQRTECRLVEQGKQFMPVHNKCTTGIDCKACPHPWIVKIECPATSDTECECGSEGYSVDGNDCIPKPRCDVDHEPRFGDGKQYNVMVCQRCEEGYSQPKSNSTDKCRKIPDPTELVTPTPIGFTSQDTSIVSETVSPFIRMESTQSPAANLTGVPSDDTTDATGTTEGPTLVTGDAIYCLTWKIGIIVGLSILAVGIFIGIGATCLYIKKYYDPLTRKAAVSKDDRSGMELEGVVTGWGDNNNRTGDEVNIDEPTSSSPLNASSPDSGRGRGKGRNKRTGKISQARKRGGHGGTN